MHSIIFITHDGLFTFLYFAFYLTDLPTDPSERDSFEINVQCKLVLLLLLSQIATIKPNAMFIK